MNVAQLKHYRLFDLVISNWLLSIIVGLYVIALPYFVAINISRAIDYYAFGRHPAAIGYDVGVVDGRRFADTGKVMPSRDQLQKAAPDRIHVVIPRWNDASIITEKDKLEFSAGYYHGFRDGFIKVRPDLDPEPYVDWSAL